jgi:hypothetical protein
MKRTIHGSLAFILLVATAAPALAQTDPAGPESPRRVMPPEQWDDRDPTTIDWDHAGRSALGDSAFFRPKKPLMTTVQVIGLNGLIWFYDRYIREGGTNPGFRVGFNSWRENLSNGWEWDDNNFTTNQFAHPYHGSLYFNAARANGYDFWESIPWTFMGSWTWEYLFETHHPSMNDWIATSVGGFTLGEMLHRLSLTVRDNTARGGERNWREVGGMAINPMGGLNRIFTGEWGKVHANPPDRFPNAYRSQMDVGLRTIADERLWSATDTTKFYLRFDFEYGDMFAGDMEKPFDFFDFNLHLHFDDVSLIGRAEIDGLLGATHLKETEPATHILAGFAKFDYVNTNQIEFGTQSLGAGLFSRFTTPSGIEIRTELQTSVIVLGANQSDYRSVSGRSYDYGPGASYDLAASLGRNGWDFLNVSHSQYWIYTANGNDSEHFVSESVVRADLPLKFNIGLGLEYRLLTSERKYDDFPDVSQRNPELRLTTTWLLN